MNDAEYAKVFSVAIGEWLNELGLGVSSIVKTSYTIYTLEAHIRYISEVHAGKPFVIEVSLLDVDEKRLHVWAGMKTEEHTLAATSEQLLMGVNEQTRKAAPFPEVIANQIAMLPLLEDSPVLAGKGIGIRRK